MSTLTDPIAKKLDEFEKQKSLNSLQDVIEIMEAMSLDAIPPGEAKSLARLNAFEQWLTVLAAINRELDPNFDPDDLPEMRVMPPASEGGIRMPGMDPSLVKDPAARAIYEKALKANREKTERYRFQTRLRRQNARAYTDVERLILTQYSVADADRSEFDKLVTAAKITSAQKDALRAVYPHEQANK